MPLKKILYFLHGGFTIFILVILFPLSAPGSNLKVLLTGFEGPDNDKANPSQALVEAINTAPSKLNINGIKIKAVTLPAIYHASWEHLKKEIILYQPDIVLSLGWAEGTDKIRLGTIAENVKKTLPDSTGYSIPDTIIPQNKPYYKSQLPVRKIEQVLRFNQIPVEISKEAENGLYNYLFYHLMNYSYPKPDIKTGFIHLPDRQISGGTGLFSALKLILETLSDVSVKVGVFEFEPRKDNINQNINMIEKIISDTRTMAIEFYIFPEMALSGLIYSSPEDLISKNPLYRSGKAIQQLKLISKKNRIYMAVGLVEKKGPDLFNSYVVFGPSGGIVLNYRKNHLFGSDLDWAKSGDGQYPYFESRFGKIGVLICHDVVYRESFVNYETNKVNFVIIGTNWIGSAPIHRYIRQAGLGDAVFFISDRKGHEHGIPFNGNTSVLTKDRIFSPYHITGRHKGIVYLYMAD